MILKLLSLDLRYIYLWNGWEWLILSRVSSFSFSRLIPDHFIFLKDTLASFEETLVQIAPPFVSWHDLQT